MRSDRAVLDARLASAEGHVRGIRRMVEEGATCAEVVRQTFAVERALERFEAQMLERHLAQCLAARLGDSRRGGALRELGELFESARSERAR